MRVLVVTSWFPSADWPGGAPFAVAHAKAIARHHDVQVAHLRLVPDLGAVAELRVVRDLGAVRHEGHAEAFPIAR